MSPSLRPGFVVVNTAMVWLTTAIASAALWPIYRSPAIVILILVTTIAASVASLLGAVFRWPGYVMVLVTAGLYLVLGVPLAVPDSALYGLLPTLDGFVGLLAGTALGWKQLLTITLPVGNYQSLLVPAFVLVLLSVAVSQSLALRSKRGDLAVLPPAVLFLGALALGPERSSWPLQLSLGLLAVILGWLAWRRWYRRREAIKLLALANTGDTATTTRGLPGFFGLRGVLSAVVILVTVVVAGIGGALFAPPTGSREVARTAIVQPFDPRAYPSPLSGFRSYEKSPAAQDTMLTVTGLPPGSRIRIATLDSYNGVVYSVGAGEPDAASGSFTRVASTFDQSSVRGKQLTVEVTVGKYSGVWVPTVGKLESIAFNGTQAAALRDSFYYNDNSGTAAVVHALGPGDRYTLTAVQSVPPSTTELAALKPGSATMPAIGVVPDDLLTTLDRYVSGVSGDGARLVAMIEGIKKNGYISHGVSPDAPFSRSGHSADRITQLLTDQRMIGDQEQYSATAALMARQLGFPARVVFGFAPTVTAASGPTAISGSDISAWIEVDTAGYGWVAIDPNPAVRPIPEEKPKDPTQVARPQSPVQPPARQPLTHETLTPPDSTPDNPAGINMLLEIVLAVLRITGWTALVLAIALSPFLAVLAAKRRRRTRRRRARDAVDRMSGAWDEFEDAVVDHGYPTPPASTRTEVAAVVGGMQPLVLAAVVDRAVFSPDEPREEEVERLWRSVEEMRVFLDAGLTRWQRIKALVSVRSLGGYSVKKLFKR